MAHVETIKLSDLTVDQTVQLRTRWIDHKTVDAYMEALASGAEFPPVTAYRQDGKIWLADGFHRVAAHRALGLADIQATVTDGDKETAMIQAALANARNGRLMLKDQKQEAAKRLQKLTNWSNRKIARELSMASRTVDRLLSAPNDADTPRAVAVTRAGTNYTMDISNIGQSNNDAEHKQWRDRQQAERLQHIANLQAAQDDSAPPASIQEITETEVFKDCGNCIHLKGEYDDCWCDALECSINHNAENEPFCKLELWQDNGNYLDEVIEMADQHGIGWDAEWPTSIELLHGDFSELGPQLEAESFDLILTDPPYGKDNIHLYELLAKESARLLKPGGSLLAMTGQLCLPETLALMTPYLNYHWTISYDTPGGQSPQIWPRKVNTFWKPILWFVKGQYEGVWHGDKIKSDVNDNDKRFHDWGQSESGIGKLVSEFAFAGAKVLDPFLGGGTTAVVCYRLRMPFTGIDISKEAIETTRNRILQEISSGK